MLMTTFTVNMTVRKFFFACCTYTHNFNFEVKLLTGQRMIAINSHLITIDVTDSHNLHATIRRRSMKLHTHFQLINTFKHFTTQISDQFSAVRSEEHTSELQSRPHLVCRLLL